MQHAFKKNGAAIEDWSLTFFGRCITPYFISESMQKAAFNMNYVSIIFKKKNEFQFLMKCR